MKIKQRIEITQGGDNVFKDLGFADEEAEELLAKAELARQIVKAIEALGMASADAARTLGIDRAKVSKITNGRLSDFSIGRLLVLVRRLSRDVEIRVRTRSRGRGRLRVRAA